MFHLSDQNSFNPWSKIIEQSSNPNILSTSYDNSQIDGTNTPLTIPPSNIISNSYKISDIIHQTPALETVGNINQIDNITPSINSNQQTAETNSNPVGQNLGTNTPPAKVRKSSKRKMSLPQTDFPTPPAVKALQKKIIDKVTGNSNSQIHQTSQNIKTSPLYTNIMKHSAENYSLNSQTNLQKDINHLISFNDQPLNYEVKQEVNHQDPMSQFMMYNNQTYYNPNHNQYYLNNHSHAQYMNQYWSQINSQQGFGFNTSQNTHAVTAKVEPINIEPTFQESVVPDSQVVPGSAVKASPLDFSLDKRSATFAVPELIKSEAQTLGIACSSGSADVLVGDVNVSGQSQSAHCRRLSTNDLSEFLVFDQTGPIESVNRTCEFASDVATEVVASATEPSTTTAVSHGMRPVQTVAPFKNDSAAQSSAHAPPHVLTSKPILGNNSTLVNTTVANMTIPQVPNYQRVQGPQWFQGSRETTGNQFTAGGRNAFQNQGFQSSGYAHWQQVMQHMHQQQLQGHATNIRHQFPDFYSQGAAHQFNYQTGQHSQQFKPAQQQQQQQVAHPSSDSPAAGTKGKRIRTMYSKLQTQVLEWHFKQSQYIGLQQRATIASHLNLSQSQVKIWFQNKRAKVRRGDKYVPMPTTSTSNESDDVNTEETNATDATPESATIVASEIVESEMVAKENVDMNSTIVALTDIQEASDCHTELQQIEIIEGSADENQTNQIFHDFANYLFPVTTEEQMEQQIQEIHPNSLSDGSNITYYSTQELAANDEH